MDYYKPQATVPPRLFPSAIRHQQPTEHLDEATGTMVQEWITELRPLPKLPQFPAELILGVGSWCLDPQTLLNLSSTCKYFARILRTVECWLDHHWGRGYDIGVLAKKARSAGAAPEQKYGTNGWGWLVKSAFEKAEFPDDEYMTQWNMGKPTPHIYIQAPWGLNVPDAFEAYQPRGVKYMQVMYDLLTEHECHNLELYPWLNDEVLKVRVKDVKSRYLQALVSASEVLIRMWSVPIAVMSSDDAVINNQTSMSELPQHDYRKTSLTSLTYAFLAANKLMQLDNISQEERKLYPHPPMGPDIWLDANGDVDSTGTAWIPRVKETWKGRVYVMGQYATISKSNKCSAARPNPNRAPLRMCLDFLPDGQIDGRGGDFGGDFLITGSYRGTFVELRKQYIDEDEDDEDVYLATGHMIPWGVYGRWTVPDKPLETLGYWCMWHFEGAPVFPISVPFTFHGIEVYPKAEPYQVNPNWFIEYEEARDAGRHINRMHGWFTDPPPPPEKVPLPEPDAWGL